MNTVVLRYGSVRGLYTVLYICIMYMQLAGAAGAGRRRQAQADMYFLLLRYGSVWGLYTVLYICMYMQLAGAGGYVFSTVCCMLCVYVRV